LKGDWNAGTEKKNFEIPQGHAQVALESENGLDCNLFQLRPAYHATSCLPRVRILQEQAGYRTRGSLIVRQWKIA
jgi:hypothetical protein